MDLGTESFVSGWLRVGSLRENVRDVAANTPSNLV